jgi:hypothetical protein
MYYHWPMLRGVIESARLVGAHSRGVAALIARQWPSRPVEHIALGEGPDLFDVAGARRQFRAAHGLPEDAIVFGVHGGLTAEKRVSDILTFASTRAGAAPVPARRTPIPGSTGRRIGRLGLTSSVCRVPAVDDAALTRRSPLRRDLESAMANRARNLGPAGASGAQPDGRGDVAHHSCAGARSPHGGGSQPRIRSALMGAVTVALMCDLRHSLRLAIWRLGTDAALRVGLRPARAWEREHSGAHGRGL